MTLREAIADSAIAGILLNAWVMGGSYHQSKGDQYRQSRIGALFIGISFVLAFIAAAFILGE